MIHKQANNHPVVRIDRFGSVEEYCLYLIHRKAYEAASCFARGKTLLDIGCNNAYGTEILGGSCRTAIGVDVSKQAIRVARKRCGSDQLAFSVADGANLPFKDGTFDVVTAFQVIEHLANPDRLIQEVKRVLSPDGLAILTTPNSRVRLQPGMKPWNEFHVREFDAKELRELLAAYFRVVTVRGLFAAEPLNSIERSRLNRERNRAGNAKGTGLVWKIKARLPKAITLCLRMLKTKAREAVHSHDVKSFMAKHNSTSCLCYSDSDKENALDLMAICGTTDAKGVPYLNLGQSVC